MFSWYYLYSDGCNRLKFYNHSIYGVLPVAKELRNYFVILFELANASGRGDIYFKIINYPSVKG